MELDSLSEYYFDKKMKGMDFSEIRRELKAKGLDDADIKIVVRDIDNKLLSSIRQKQNKSSVNATRMIGICLVFGGVILTVGTYAGWIKMGDYFIFAYGPILGGLAMISASKRDRPTLFDKRSKSRR